ncbi:MAG: alcohol dehydrogenase [Bacteroidetes bacterium]|nr:MAG: alcohol dehydrogenase [Bacteroidota bacterium]
MKGWVLKDKNQDLEWQDVADISLSPAEALVQIHAAAINHRDLWIQKGKYAGLKFPIVPGSDGAGIVKATGAETNDSWVGKEVIIDPAMHWGDDPGFQDPKNFSILGLPQDGTWAEYVKVPVTNLYLKPAHLSFEDAAAIPLAGATAFRGLFTRGKINAKEKLLITGIGGGVALMALQFALAANVDVYVSSGSEEKIKKAVALGAMGGVSYRQDNWVEKLKETAGAVDIILDGAGGDGMNDLFKVARPGGRVVFYGATMGNPSVIEVRRIFWNQLNILGTTMGNPQDFGAMIEFVNAHKIRPVVDQVFDFSQVNEALKKMDEARQFGKMVLKLK